MTNNQPHLTIITACLNCVEFITEAVESVLSQNYSNIEHIIIDSGSTDGTYEILNRYPHLRIFSESPQGVYSAWNKGINIAKGELIGFLNADDLYASNIFSQIAQSTRNNPDILAFTGKATYFQQPPDKERQILRTTEICIPENFLHRITHGREPINAWFFRKNLFERIGYFKSSYRLSADREFLFRFAANQIPFKALECVLYHYREHPGSLTFGKQEDNLLRSLQENIRITEEMLQKKQYSENVQNACRAWHDRRVLDLISYYWKRYKYWKIPITILRGIYYSPGLALSLSRNLSDHLDKYILK